jgi:transposase
MIQQLYELEKTYKSEGLTPNQRKERRMMEAKPVYDRLMNWVEENDKLPQLESYLKDGLIEIDNNLFKNKIRPLALGRTNYLFSGSHERAEGYLQKYWKLLENIR